MRPDNSSVSEKAFLTALSSETSHIIDLHFVPKLETSCSAAAFFFGLVPHIHTLAPDLANAHAIPRPIPLLPPVTKTVLPVSCKESSVIANVPPYFGRFPASPKEN